ncbi:MAG: rhodanese-like domain-containing protein [Bacteroidales bacterium]|nr:rhodanese-like domain-containing protein [Bacteroidales bacterium]
MYNLWKCLFVLLVIPAALICPGCSEEKEPGIPGILVSTQWLQDHIDNPDVVLLHSGSAEFFDSLHIPGARFIDPASFTVNTDLVRNEMPSADSILKLLRSVGVDDNSRIVLYHESSRLLSRTARVFAALDGVGLGERTFFLNGGLPAWEEEARETTGVKTQFSYGTLSKAESGQVLIEAEELDRGRWSPDMVVVDVRTGEEYYGTPGSQEEPAEGGHVEGAYSLPYQSLLRDDYDYFFKSDAALKDLFREAGMDPGKVNVVYCGSGVRASVSYLAARHMGYNVRLYDGSWEEWKQLELPLTGPVTPPGDTE